MWEVNYIATEISLISKSNSLIPHINFIPTPSLRPTWLESPLFLKFITRTATVISLWVPLIMHWNKHCDICLAYFFGIPVSPIRRNMIQSFAGNFPGNILLLTMVTEKMKQVTQCVIHVLWRCRFIRVTTHPHSWGLSHRDRLN